MMKKYFACMMIGILTLIGCAQPTNSSEEPEVLTAKPAENSNFPWDDSTVPYTNAGVVFSTTYYRETSPGGIVVASSTQDESVNGISYYAMCDSPGVYWFKFTNFKTNYDSAEFVSSADAIIDGKRYSFNDDTVDITGKQLYNKNGLSLATLQTINNPKDLLDHCTYSYKVSTLSSDTYWLKLTVSSVEYGSRIYIYCRQKEVVYEYAE